MTATLIYQDVLDISSAAILAGDFDTYLAAIHLPYLLHFLDGDIVIDAASDLRPSFHTLSEGMARRGVSHYERVARDAHFQGSERIVGRHSTHMIAEGSRVQAPHAAEAALVRVDGGSWRFTEATYPLASHDWPLGEAAIFGNRLAGTPIKRVLA